MLKSLTALAVLLAACGGSSTGPALIDPTVLITNLSTTDTLVFTWRDGQGITGGVTVLPGGSSCTKFLAQADSAYFDAQAHGAGGAGGYTQPWFDPSSRPAWTMSESHPNGSGPLILVQEVTPEPC